MRATTLSLLRSLRLPSKGFRGLLFCILTAPLVSAGDSFQFPAPEAYPETWFHLIGGNVSKDGLTADLEAIQQVGMAGIQLFHGSGGEWPDVPNPIQTLSPEWDDLIGHVVDETQRLDLRFTMQNCPGWAMSGGPWITPENAMRHLVWSRTEVTATSEAVSLPRPADSEADWRDYQDIAVIAFPTPEGDSDPRRHPVAFRSNRPNIDWQRSLDQTLQDKAEVVIEPHETPTWVEFDFAEPTTLRAIEFPPTDYFLMRRIFHPKVVIEVEALTANGPVNVARRNIPRGSWQDKDWDARPVSIALSDAVARTYRIRFINENPLSLRSIGFTTRATVNDWHGQSGFVLRSLDFSPHPVQSTAAFIAPEQIIDLTDSFTDGELDWKAPPGTWTVLRIGHVNTGTKNKPAPPEATGFEADKLSTRGADQHFPAYIGRLSAPGGPADGGRLHGMLIDSWECFTQTWTPTMAEDFAARRGYEMKAFFPALLGYVVNDHETSERFLRDWRATIGDLMVDNYFGRLAEHARERGMQLSFEAAAGDVAIGDILQYFSKADIPMTEYWAPNDPHWGGLEGKPAAPAVSAANIYGKDRVAAESFTQFPLDWKTHPFALKHIADKHYAAGVNHVIFHTFTHNPSLKLIPGTSFGAPIGSPFIRNQTWWQHMPAFTTYLARCNATLQRGKNVADVLWYLGDSIDHKPRQDAAFPEGYKFDYLNADALLNYIEVDGGDLTNAQGNRWRLIWLRPENCRQLTLTTLQRLESLLRSGATVVGPAPRQRAGLSGGEEADRAFREIISRLWGTAPANSGDRQIGQGRLLWGHGLDGALGTLGIESDVRGTRNGNWIHRREANREIYFVTAHRDASLKANLDFRSTGQPELWNPVTGETTPMPVFHTKKGRTTVAIDLPIAGSAFIVFEDKLGDPSLVRIEHDGELIVDAADAQRRDPTPTPSTLGLIPGQPKQPRFQDALPPYGLSTKPNRLVVWEPGHYVFHRSDGSQFEATVAPPQSIPVDGPWSLTFPEGWETLSEVPLEHLQPWSELEDPATRSFSGTATYQTHFDLPPRKADDVILLDLEAVGEIAKVFLNGEEITTLWGAPYRCDITAAVKDGKNLLTIEVTNTWHNRLAYDAARPEAERTTWTTHPPSADTPLAPSGLLQNVSIHFGNKIQL